MAQEDAKEGTPSEDGIPAVHFPKVTLGKKFFGPQTLFYSRISVRPGLGPFSNWLGFVLCPLCSLYFPLFPLRRTSPEHLKLPVALPIARSRSSDPLLHCIMRTARFFLCWEQDILWIGHHLPKFHFSAMCTSGVNQIAFHEEGQQFLKYFARLHSPLMKRGRFRVCVRDHSSLIKRARHSSRACLVPTTRVYFTCKSFEHEVSEQPLFTALC